MLSPPLRKPSQDLLPLNQGNLHPEIVNYHDLRNYYPETRTHHDLRKHYYHILRKHLRLYPEVDVRFSPKSKLKPGALIPSCHAPKFDELEFGT